MRFWSLDHHRAEEILWPTSDWDKLVFAVEGTIHVETARKLHVLPPNRALWVPADDPHPARTLGKAKVRTLYFAPQLRLQPERHVMDVRQLFRELIAESCRLGPLRADCVRGNALLTLLLEELKTAGTAQTSIAIPQSPWLHQWAMKFLKNPRCEWPAGVSRRTIERRILKETGLTLGQWRQQARALVGLQVLSSGATVLEAAMEAGFETSSGFIQSFRKQFGTTPGRMLH